MNGYILRRAPEEERARLIGRVPDNHERGQHTLSVMEQHFRANDWFVADRYSIADIALYAYTHSADEGGFDPSGLRVSPRLARPRAQATEPHRADEGG